MFLFHKGGVLTACNYINSSTLNSITVSKCRAINPRSTVDKAKENSSLVVDFITSSILRECLGNRKYIQNDAETLVYRFRILVSDFFFCLHILVILCLLDGQNSLLL